MANFFFILFFFYLYIYPPDSQESDGGAVCASVALCQVHGIFWTTLPDLASLPLNGRASEWTNHKRKAEYCENASRLRAFVSETGARPVGMSLPRAARV